MQSGSTEDIAYANISHKLTQLPTRRSKCTIYRVHKHLRSINDKAYEPEIISIGPYHRNKDNLKMMEDFKWQYLNLLIQEKQENKKKLISVVGELEQEARRCYAEQIDLSPSEFIETLVLDGCFIINLVRKYSMEFLRDKNDPIFQMDWMMNTLQRDLMLFENQIPFFVLSKLFALVEVPNQDDRLMFLVLKFFSSLYPGKGYNLNLDYTGLDHEIKHLLDLIHTSWLPPCACFNIDLKYENDHKIKRWQFIRCATKLREANVNFVSCELDNNNSLFEVDFKRGIMRLPPLTIEDRTESFFRNLIAYEQYFKVSTFVTDYVKFLDCLVDSSRDVEILRRNGIIESWLGDEEVIADMFNKLAESVIGPGKGFVYGQVCENVNEHCNKRRNRWMAKLRRNYLNSPWGVISVLAAVLLLILTATQAVSSILQVV